MEKLTINSKATLNDGHSMPLLGLGVFQLKDRQECIDAVHAALDCGYRHIDTAIGYNNEEDVGSAIEQSKLDREEIFVTSKIMPAAFVKLPPREAVEQSLRKLRLDYIDLYLIHWPVREGTEETYEILQAMREEGKIRSVGVSNFTERRFEEQFFKRIKEIPAVNQVERHPYHANTNTLEYCRKKGIQAEAYSPLAQASALQDETLNEIAQSHGKSPAQIMIRWQLQQGVVVIPKSANPKRIAQNADVFDFSLPASDMERIDGLNREESVITWKPEENWF